MIETTDEAAGTNQIQIQGFKSSVVFIYLTKYISYHHSYSYIIQNIYHSHLYIRQNIYHIYHSYSYIIQIQNCRCWCWSTYNTPGSKSDSNFVFKHLKICVFFQGDKIIFWLITVTTMLPGVCNQHSMICVFQ